MKKRYVVQLSGVEREQLEGLVKRGRGPPVVAVTPKCCCGRTKANAETA